MSTSTGKDDKPKSADPPEQKLGDTPVLPWEMPTPEEKAQAKSVRRALKEAIENVDSPEKADEVINELEAATTNQTVTDIKQTQPPVPTPASAARQVETAAQTAPEGKKTEQVLNATAEVIAASDKHEREVVSEAVQEVLNPEQQGSAATVVDVQKR